MPKYRKPPQDIVEKPTFFVKHYWNLFVEWLAKNKDQVMTGVLVGAIVLLGAVVWQRYSASRMVEAWSEVGTAGGAAGLETAVARYGATPAGAFLKLRLADLYANEGQADKAVTIYREMSGDKEFCERARYSLALAQEGAGKFDEAADSLKALAAAGGFWGQQATKAQAAQAQRKAAYESFMAASQAAAAAKAPVKAPAPVETPETPPAQESQQAEELQSTESVSTGGPAVTEPGGTSSGGDSSADSIQQGKE
jgi:predicted negative regulator of RcsB-dependent stress response